MIQSNPFSIFIGTGTGKCRKTLRGGLGTSEENIVRDAESLQRRAAKCDNGCEEVGLVRERKGGG